MPPAPFLDVLPLWAILALSFLLFLLASESGYRLGWIRQRERKHEKEPTVGGIVAAELGLLAFLLAFTFGLAASRFEARRQTLLDEANAIGTSYLRAELLPEPQRTDVQKLLREYVDARLTAANGKEVEAEIHRSEEVHGHLWKAAQAAVEKDPHSIPAGLFVQSLNDVIDLHAKRLSTVFGSRIPTVVWFVLIAVAVLSFGSMGYEGGLSGVDRSPATLPLTLAFAIVMWMVVDLERPQEGLLKISQRPMVDLRSTMKESKP
jgi:hypothetical protein